MLMNRCLGGSQDDPPPLPPNLPIRSRPSTHRASKFASALIPSSDDKTVDVSSGIGSEAASYNTLETGGYGSSQLGDSQESGKSDLDMTTLVRGFTPDDPFVPPKALPPGHQYLPGLKEESNLEYRNSVMKTRCVADSSLAKKVIAQYAKQQRGWCLLMDAKGNKGTRHEGYIQVKFFRLSWGFMF